MTYKIPAKLLKFSSSLGLSLILAVSMLASLSAVYTPKAHAVSLPSYRYTKNFDASATEGSADGYGVATDSTGNIYVTGYFNGTVVFDGVGGADSQTSANQSSFLTKYNANGTYGYTKIFDTTAGYAYGYGVATDTTGNIYVTGNFSGTVIFDGIGGSDSQTSANTSTFLTKYNANGTYGYTKIFDTSAAGAYANGTGVATDSSGNIYVTGNFNGTVIFDGVGGTDSQTTVNDSSFLTKYNANGSYAYTKIFDTSASGAYAYSYGVATDTTGNIYVTGNFNGTVIFDGVGGSDSQTTAGGSSFLAKYNANGSYGYTKIFDTSAGNDNTYAVATDTIGNIYVPGNFTGTVVFDGVGGTDSQTSASESSFLTKYNANGNYGYTKIFDTSAVTASVYGKSVATDSNGNIYITGYFTGTVVFDGVSGTDRYTSVNDNSAFLTKYNANGSYGYTKIFDTSAGYANGYGVATDSTGNIYVTGNFSGTVIFDGIGGSDTQTTANNSSFLTKYNANGSYGYTKIFDTSAGWANGTGVAIDSSGNIYITGYFGSTVVFDGVGGTDSQTSANASSFLTKYNANGTYGYTKIFDTSAAGADAEGYGVATDSSGNVYMTGCFSGGTVVFDGVGGTDSQTSANTSTFLTKYNANGTYGYTKIFDTSAAGAIGAGVATDSSGNIYATGNFGGTVVFDGVGGTDSQTSANGSSFLTKYNANGSYGYTKIFDTSSGSAEGYGVATDSTGNVYVTGSFYDTVIFDGVGGTDSQTSANGSSFLTKYNANGSYGYTKIFDTSAGNAYGNSVATDTTGNVYVTGTFSGTVGFNGAGNILTSINSNMFLTSYQVFIPIEPISSSPAPSLPGAPNTGYGVHMTNPLVNLVSFGLVALGLAVLALTAHKHSKQLTKV